MTSYLSAVRRDIISFTALGDHSVRIEGRLSAILFNLSQKRLLWSCLLLPCAFIFSSFVGMHRSFRKGPVPSCCFDSGFKYKRSTAPYFFRHLAKFIVRILPPVFSGSGCNKEMMINFIFLIKKMAFSYL